MDTSAEIFLNDALTKKPMIRRILRERKKYNDCKLVHKGGDWFEECFERERIDERTIVEHARVTSTEVVEVKNLLFDKTKITSLPTNARVAIREFKNCSEGIDLTQNITLSVSATRGWSVTKTNSISTTIGASVTLSGEFEFFKGSGTVNFSQTVSLSSQTTETFSTTETRSISDTIIVHPKKAGIYRLIAYEQTLEIPFSGIAVVDGQLVSNESGVSKASDVLSVNERTMPLSGSLRITDVSKAETRIDEFPYRPACEDKSDIAYYSDREFTVPAQALTERFLSGFSLPSKARRNEKGWREPAPMPKDEIGPPDGRHFDVDYETEEMRSDPGQCGFNDIGAPNFGVYKVLHGTWREYANGQIVASYPGTQETFLRCYEP